MTYSKSTLEALRRLNLPLDEHVPVNQDAKGGE